MLESAALGQRTAAALLGWLNGARLGRILLECEMGARAVVIEEVAAQTTTEVSLVEDNHVVEQFASDGANDSLGERVLPGRAWCGEHFGDADASHPSPKLVAVDVVAIAQEVTRRRFIGKCFDDLLRRPDGGGGIGDVEMYDSSAMMQQNHKHVEHPEGRSRHDEEVDGNEVGEVVLKERAPTLREWLRATRDEPGNGAL